MQTSAVPAELSALCQKQKWRIYLVDLHQSELSIFLAIAQSTGLPIILYDVPSRTVVGLADETVARLAEVTNIMRC